MLAYFYYLNQSFFFKLKKCLNIFAHEFRFIKPEHTCKKAEYGYRNSCPASFVCKKTKWYQKYWSYIPTPLIVMSIKNPVKEDWIYHCYNQK